MADRPDVTISKDCLVIIEAEMVVLWVGVQQKAFYIRKQLLIQRSPYLKDQLEAADNTKQPIQLSNIKAEIFDLYYWYICKSKIPCGKDAKAYVELVELYVLASTLLDFAAMDAVINAMLVVYSTSQTGGSWGIVPCAESVLTAYKSTAAGSKLRRLLVDMFVWWEDPESLGKDFQAQPLFAPFLLDLSQATLAQLHSMSQATDIGYFEASCCNYHEHAKGDACPNRKRKRAEDDSSVLAAALR